MFFRGIVGAGKRQEVNVWTVVRRVLLLLRNTDDFVKEPIVNRQDAVRKTIGATRPLFRREISSYAAFFQTRLGCGVVCRIRSISHVVE
jgi:hypothetical protein